VTSFGGHLGWWGDAASSPWGPAALGALVSAIAAAVLIRVAPRLRWVDGGTSERKRGTAPIPLVGGAAALAGVIAGWLAVELAGRDQAAFVPGRELGQLVASRLRPDATLWPLGALLAAFAVGTIDDVLTDGLPAGLKLVGQALSGFVLGLPLVVAEPSSASAWGVVALLSAGAVLALNAVNTFDNADGAATGLGTLAFAATAPLFAASLAAFLPFNSSRRGPAPRAILGDAGSHVVGMLFLLVPSAWPALALPLIDAARVAIVRARLGEPPWRGDRRHLAHRLAANGLAPRQVALLLAAIAAPSALLAPLGAPWLALGLVTTTISFAVTLRRAPAPPEPALARRASAELDAPGS
jgi:UDP-N-acetylmuramyl pentapeptide phosphotransferase/UDP-N-acetylglucosamine-1-phosphate transferase